MAEWCYEQIKDKQNDIGCFLDLEDSSIASLDKTTLTNYAISYCRLLDNYGIISGTYANKSWYTTKLEVERLLQFKIWLAEWREGHHTANFRVDVWQYSDNGQVDGITGRVDMNILYGEGPIPPIPVKKHNNKKWGLSQNFKLNIG